MAVTSPGAFRESELPGLWQAADRSSRRAQHAYRRGTAAVLGSLVVASVGGAVTTDFGPGSLDWGGAVSAVAFLVAVVMQLHLAQGRPERGWYEGRAVAESAKSLGWQFAVAGGQYPLADSNARAQMIRDLECLLEDIGDARPFDLPPGVAQISGAMDALRHSALDVRRQSYLASRIRDQRAWYSAKARFNRKRAAALLAITVVLEVVGGTAAVLKATGVVAVDLLGILSAIGAGIVAWSQLNDHIQLEEAYSLASHDLGLVEAALEDVGSEAEWQTFVGNAEQAISREHRMWRAARATRMH